MRPAIRFACRSGGSRSAMTLIELMISVALGMMVIAMAWTAYVRTNSTTARATTRVDMHVHAAMIRSYFNADIQNSSPTTAVFVRSVPHVDSTDPAGQPIRTDTVETVFMRMVYRPDSETFDDEWADGMTRKSELYWVRWRFVRTWRQIEGAWAQTSGVLSRSQSSVQRQWGGKSSLVPSPKPLNTCTGSLVNDANSHPGTLWTNYGGATFINIPRPLRDASQGIGSLDNNRYGSPDPMDIGDLTDLDDARNDRVISTRIRDFAIGWHDARGGDMAVTSSVAADHRIDGLYMDVTGPNGNAYADQLGLRPRVMRATFSMHEARIGLIQDFSFSAAAPGMQSLMGQ